MLVDFSRSLLDHTGKPIADGDAELTLRVAACNAVIAVIPGEVLTGIQKVERAQLARRIYGASEPLALTVEQVALLKQTINAWYLSPLLVSAAWELLDPVP